MKCKTLFNLVSLAATLQGRTQNHLKPAKLCFIHAKWAAIRHASAQ